MHNVHHVASSPCKKSNTEDVLCSYTSSRLQGVGRLNPVVELLHGFLSVNMKKKIDYCTSNDVEAAVKVLTSMDVLLQENTSFYNDDTKKNTEITAGLGKWPTSQCVRHSVFITFFHCGCDETHKSPGGKIILYRKCCLQL